MADTTSSNSTDHSAGSNHAVDTSGSTPTANRVQEPSLTAESNSVAMSLIIPALNESSRLPPYLRSIRPYMDTRFGDDYQVIVVDDGSTDQTPSILEKLGREWPQLSTTRHAHNLGKGAAVRSGVVAALGVKLLYADADGATSIEEEARLRAAIDAGADIAVGSRLIADKTVDRHRTWKRALIGRAFATVARLMIPVPVRDTQCGFKMLRGDVGKQLFGRVQENGYLFDLELLALAQLMHFHVAEVPINWQDQPGSQLDLRRQLLRVPKDLWRVRRRVRQLR